MNLNNDISDFSTRVEQIRTYSGLNNAQADGSSPLRCSGFQKIRRCPVYTIYNSPNANYIPHIGFGGTLQVIYPLQRSGFFDVFRVPHTTNVQNCEVRCRHGWTWHPLGCWYTEKSLFFHRAVVLAIGINFNHNP